MARLLSNVLTGLLATLHGASGIEDSLALMQANRMGLKKGRRPLTASAIDSQQAVTAWLAANGGHANPHIAQAMTSHGGFHVRGAIATANMSHGEVVFRVPKKLWLHIDNFPEFGDIHFPGKGCRKEKGNWARLALVVAVEIAKGEASFWSPWLQHLPKLEDYRSYHPILINEGTARDFGQLQFVRGTRRVTQAGMNRTLACLRAVRLQPAKMPVGVSALREDDVAVALMHLYARSYYSDGTVAMIPGPDLLNTGQDDSVNTDYREPHGDAPYELKVDKAGGVTANEELYDSYCPDCSNYDYMRSWGIFLGKGAHKIKERSQRCPMRLRRIVVSALEDLEVEPPAQVAPRCHADVMNQEQGPLRCSLARLAFEVCKDKWL